MNMQRSFNIAIAQLNFTVGDIAGNVARIIAAHGKAAEEKADLVVFPEMCITGYPPEDLVLRKGFQDEAMRAVQQLASATANGTAMLIGGIWREGKALYNTAFLLDGGKIAHRQYKHNLPNYGVFDEMRVFAAGPVPKPAAWRGINIGILICEDMWSQAAAYGLCGQGAQALLSINSSPYEVKKHDMRMNEAQARVKETGLPLLYVNQIGGQDELVFDGGSFVMGADGKLQSQLHSFREDLALIRLTAQDARAMFEGGKMEPRHRGEENIYSAMMLGLLDYVEKNHFPGVLLGLSGGIDSALTAAVAVDALGSDRVRAVMMPSPYTAREGIEDAAKCAGLFGIRLDTIPISPAMQVMNNTLAPLFSGREPDITEENIQSRLRGAILMAISNKFGLLVLTTGNKSELAAGYATLYGDMCGGFNVLKDVYKTEVYKLARWRNRQSVVIPERILTRAPTAELRPNQTDQDSLPPYDVLDAILLRLVERQMSIDDIVQQGYERMTVEKVAKLLVRSEYKRRQAAPGVKITSMSFGRDRRYPLTDAWIA